MPVAAAAVTMDFMVCSLQLGCLGEAPCFAPPPRDGFALGRHRWRPAEYRRSTRSPVSDVGLKTEQVSSPHGGSAPTRVRRGTGAGSRDRSRRPTCQAAADAATLHPPPG